MIVQEREISTERREKREERRRKKDKWDVLIERENLYEKVLLCVCFVLYCG